MNKLVKWCQRLFVDGLSGMALGLFSTLIIGTIMVQFATFIGGDIGTYLLTIGKLATILTGAGIGCGVANKFKESPLVVISAAVTGMIGAYAGAISSGQLLQDGTVVLSGPGEPLGAFVAAYIAIEVGHVVSGKTKLDILLTPVLCIGCGAVIGILVGPPISSFMADIGAVINMATESNEFVMGVVVSVIMGMALTLPISSAALGIMLNLSGLAAGAATVGCCANMVGFAVASYHDNKVGGLLAQGVGTSMLQVSNIVKKPTIWLPAILSSAILGPLSTMVFKMTNNAAGSGMGTAGLVGPIMTYNTMVAQDGIMIVLVKIVLIQFVLPALLAFGISEFMRKRGWIKAGDMKITV